MDDAGSVCFLCQAEETEENDAVQVLQVRDDVYLCDGCFNNILTALETGSDDFDHFFLLCE